VTASPTVVDGTVYIGSHDNHLYALDAETGSQAWQFETEMAIEKAAAVTPAGDSPFSGAGVFFGDQWRFYGVDGDSAESRWSQEITEVSAPVLADDGVFFSGDKLNRIRTEDGTREWVSLELRRSTEDGAVYSTSPTPSVADGTIYAGAANGEIVAADPATGTADWGFPAGKPIRSPPAVQDGRVFIGDSEGTLYAVEDGSEAWQFSDPTDGITAAPTISDGTVFVGSQDGTLYALGTESGDERWRFGADGPVPSSPTVADGTVFFGSADGHVYAVEADSGEEVWRFDTGDIVRSSPTVVDGVLFVGGWNGNVYALDAGVSGSSSGTRVEQGVLGHHHSHVGADEQRLDPAPEFAVQTPGSGGSDSEEVSGFSSSDDGGPGFGVGTALAGLGAGALWARRRLAGE
jgi:PGF-CTERM protein